MKKTISLIIAVIAFVTINTLNAADASATGPKPNKGYIAEKVVADIPTTELAQALVKGYLAEEAKTNKVNGFPVVTVGADKMISDLLNNEAEIGFVVRKPTITEQLNFWVQFQHMQRSPFLFKVAYDVHSKADAKQPVYLIVDRVKMDRWDRFVKFCLSDKGQEIIDANFDRFASLPYGQRGT